MMLIYSGAHPEVVVDELNPDQVIVAGQPVDMPDDLAARLLEQNTWALVETASQRKAREKAEKDAADAEAAAQAQADAESKAAADQAAAVAISEDRVTEVPDPAPADDTTTKDAS